MSSTLSNPLDKYPNLTSSNDSNAKRIVNDFNIIFSNIVIMNTSEDVTTLNHASILINNTWNDIINYVTPCSTISNSDKCSLPVCNWVKEIEQLFIYFLILLSSIDGLNTDPIKENYQFLPFFFTNNFSKMIYLNPDNQIPHMNPVKYGLCALNSNNTYSPPDDNSSMNDEWNALNKKMEQQQTTVINAVSTNTSFNFLLYILLPTAVIIILILLYIKYAKNAKIEEDALRELYHAK